jgi:beta-lactamase regulating signal transducer with metallopeptidase domain
MMSFTALPDAETLLPFLFDVALKSALLLILAKAVLLLTRRASAATRHLILSGAICGLLALPVLALILPTWQLPLLPSLLSTASAATAKVAIQPEGIASVSDSYLTEQNLERASHSDHLLYSSHIPATTPNWQHNAISPIPENNTAVTFSSSQTPPTTERQGYQFGWFSLLLLIWMVGTAVVLLRMLLGMLKVWWIARKVEPITDVCWEMMTRNLATKLQLRKPIKLQKSKRIAVPMTWGTLRPVVLLPDESEEWSLQCRSIVLLHELAHVKRFDCLTQMMAQLACAVYWFNPLVWYVAQQLRVEREFACDDYVLEAGTRATDYASHLVEIASAFRVEAQVASMAVGMACSELESRVRAILNADLSRRTINVSQMTLAVFGVLLLVLPLAVIQPWANAASRSDTRIASDESVTEQSETRLSKEDSARLNTSVQVNITDENQQKSSVTHTHESKEQHQVEVSATIESGEIQQSAPHPVSHEDVVEVEVQSDEKSSAKDEKPSTKPTVDGATRMKVYNITPEFIESMRKLGFDNLSINQLVQFRIHNVNEEFIREARNWGFDNLTPNQLMQLRMAGITAAYIETMKRAGFTNLSVNKLANLRLHNVTPEYIEMLRRLGYDNLSLDQLLSLKVHDVTEEFIRSTESWGYGKLSINDLAQVKIFNVNPEFAREMQSLGFGNLSLRNLIQLRVQGVNTGFVQEMRNMGFSNLSLEELLQMKIHGINANYIKMMRDAGFKNVSVQELIRMRLSGVDEILLKKNR